jgi:chromosome segregation ATPase
MAEDKRFHFGGDDPAPDGPIFQEDINHRRIERLSRRIMVLTVLLPLLFGLLLYFGYRDLSSRMSLSQDSGFEQARKLSEDILPKLNAISDKLVEYETRFAATQKALQETGALLDQRSAAYDTADAALASSAESNAESIEKLASAFEALKQEKLDKSAFDQYDAALKDALAPLNSRIASLDALKEEIEALAPLREEIDSMAAVRQELETVSARLAALEDSLGKDLNAFATYVEKTNKDLEQLQSSLSAMSKDMVGQEELRLELLKVRKSQRLTVLQEITRVQKTLNTLKDRVTQLERNPPRSSVLRPPSRTPRPPTASTSADVSEQELAD